MTQTQSTIPRGFCQCGCGGRTRLAGRTRERDGWVKGEPLKYIRNHQNCKPVPPYTGDGLCQCGCGCKTSVPKRNGPGRIKGQPNRYLPGHGRRIEWRKGYAVEDRGHDTPCWVWQGTVRKFDDYGVISRGRKQFSAHVYVYEAIKGPVPEGLELDHLCRVRPCINPDHLEPVTSTENKRRGKATKLTREQAVAIRAAGEAPIRALAQKYGVSVTAIWRIRSGAGWQGV